MQFLTVTDALKPSAGVTSFKLKDLAGYVHKTAGVKQVKIHSIVALWKPLVAEDKYGSCMLFAYTSDDGRPGSLISTWLRSGRSPKPVKRSHGDSSDGASDFTDVDKCTAGVSYYASVASSSVEVGYIELVVHLSTRGVTGF